MYVVGIAGVFVICSAAPPSDQDLNAHDRSSRSLLLPRKDVQALSHPRDEGPRRDGVATVNHQAEARRLDYETNVDRLGTQLVTIFERPCESVPVSRISG